ncbi:hypothetical protein EMIHUDRAFT_213223 [Emiliania huxleyi CCMP1516]|uniref:Uncharacterized protein n=2 Tax=Emiliania huxleyi TaxID=2903 RepID=A0A0D3INX1_EMIH1|nr:hypothetical protein EMIHUDRAFT_213223 [Emiliania huxleyi CCMP1516]EOD12956.1 hypothetical protein EMIHUDRAFT_213223 [Emiliania huxleyi CCMP1516]|eukprot:XP_005765385.1 hypothetical protein EMIHUDRAFT_213223 [Emiliania huxleyi CCMP1516]
MPRFSASESFAFSEWRPTEAAADKLEAAAADKASAAPPCGGVVPPELLQMGEAVAEALGLYARLAAERHVGVCSHVLSQASALLSERPEPAPTSPASLLDALVAEHERELRDKDAYHTRYEECAEEQRRALVSRVLAVEEKQAASDATAAALQQANESIAQLQSHGERLAADLSAETERRASAAEEARAHGATIEALRAQLHESRLSMSAGAALLSSLQAEVASLRASRRRGELETSIVASELEAIEEASRSACMARSSLGTGGGSSVVAVAMASADAGAKEARGFNGASDSDATRLSASSDEECRAADDCATDKPGAGCPVPVPVGAASPSANAASTAIATGGDGVGVATRRAPSSAYATPHAASSHTASRLLAAGGDGAKTRLPEAASAFEFTNGPQPSALHEPVASSAVSAPAPPPLELAVALFGLDDALATLINPPARMAMAGALPAAATPSPGQQARVPQNKKKRRRAGHAVSARSALGPVRKLDLFAEDD